MRRLFLIVKPLSLIVKPLSLIAALFLLIAAPLAAQEYPNVYPEELFGIELEEALEFWATPAEERYTFYGAPPFPDPPRFGYVGAAELIDLGAVITLQGMNNIYGFVYGLPPGHYGTGLGFPWDADCGCYLGMDEAVDGIAPFEAWVFNGDGTGAWIIGCLQFNPRLFPQWLESEECVWTVHALGPIPEWKEYLHRRSGGKRAK